ncbi:MAG: hypothetical protein MZV70_36235 [Desulfobacterales bacterium]|nr:hypothetical protein [Desulfobacterales bacterium]
MRLRRWPRRLQKKGRRRRSRSLQSAEKEQQEAWAAEETTQFGGTPREKFESEELRGQRTDERKRLKGLYVGKTWNAQNIIDYFMREEGLDKNAAKVEGRKAYKRYEGGKHKWESLINYTTRRRFGGGGEQGGAPAAPAAPATPVSQTPCVPHGGQGESLS